MVDYAAIAEIQAMENMSAVTDAEATEAIEYAEELIDRFTGTSWVYKAFEVTVSGTDNHVLWLKDDEGRVVMFPRTVSSVTVDGVVDPATDWVLHPDGALYRKTGVFDNAIGGRNVVVAGTAGLTESAPVDIKWCTRTIARQYILDLVSRLPERATGVQTPDGNIQLAQASAHPDRPTSLPDVNARLVRRRQRGPGIL